MKCGLILSLLITIPCMGQTKVTGEAKTAGPCSPAVTGSNNRFQITCKIDEKQGQKMLDILNKILTNQLDPNKVMEKLDEILKAVNPNLPVKTYVCNGTWRTIGPSATAATSFNIGGDDSVYQQMVRLNNTGQYADLLKACLAQIDSAPEWLTPRLFCGLAYLGTGDKVKAKAMLDEFDARTGPAYDTNGCRQASDHLHEQLK